MNRNRPTSTLTVEREAYAERKAADKRRTNARRAQRRLKYAALTSTSTPTGGAR